MPGNSYTSTKQELQLGKIQENLEIIWKGHMGHVKIYTKQRKHSITDNRETNSVRLKQQVDVGNLFATQAEQQQAFRQLRLFKSLAVQ